MGQTIRNLSTQEVSGAPIFPKRLVVECCEKFHFHYRNLRILLSLEDWREFASGVSQALERWENRGRPLPEEGTHIELCRKSVASNPADENVIKVNLNKNLYKDHEGRIFSEGSDFKDQDYIHLKIRDIRLELSHDEFNQLSKAILEAKEKLDG